uniref:Uncharacterized protein n=1 Tax=Graphocephala atropunctata TaxID=36148 RepID=A0A1B6KYG3_9HEMI
MYGIRWYVMGRHSTTIMSVKHNIIPDSDKFLVADTSSSYLSSQHTPEVEECSTAKLLDPLLDNETFKSECERDFTLNFNDCTSIIVNEKSKSSYDVIMKEESLCYITGYVAFKIQNKYPDLGEKTKNVCKTEDDYKYI